MPHFEIFSDQHSTLAPYLASHFDKQLHVINVEQFPSTETKLNGFADADIAGKNILYVHQFFSGLQEKKLYNQQNPLVLSFDRLRMIGALARRSLGVGWVSKDMSGSQTINQSLFDLLLILASFKASGAKKITLLMPYLPYARQDKPITTENFLISSLVTNMLHNAGAGSLITYDLHNPTLTDQISLPVKNLTATAHWINLIKNVYPTLNNICIATPDHGALVRAQPVAQKLGVPLICLTKKRTENQVSIADVDGDVAGKQVILIDDILDTGHTAIAACNALLEHGAQSVSGYFSHAVFSADALEHMQESRFEKIFIGNSLLYGPTNLDGKFVLVDTYESIFNRMD